MTQGFAPTRVRELIHQGMGPNEKIKRGQIKLTEPSDDYTVHDWSGDHRFTVAGVVDDAAQNRAIFPDWKEQVQSMVAEGDLVADRFLSTGTQAQDIPAVPHLMPVIPNKKRATQMPEIEIIRISNGKLAEQWDISDGWNANAQLGLFDPDNWPNSVCKSGDSRPGLH